MIDVNRNFVNNTDLNEDNSLTHQIKKMDPMNDCYQNIKNNWHFTQFPKEILVIIYKSLIMPHLNYGSYLGE